MHVSNAADLGLARGQSHHHLPGLRDYDPAEPGQAGRIRRSDGAGVRAPATGHPNRASNDSGQGSMRSSPAGPPAWNIAARCRFFSSVPLIAEGGCHMTKRARRRWSREVTELSDALDLRAGVFTWKDPKRIAPSLKRSAESRKRRKAAPFRSPLTIRPFYINSRRRTL